MNYSRLLNSEPLHVSIPGYAMAGAVTSSRCKKDGEFTAGDSGWSFSPSSGVDSGVFSVAGRNNSSSGEFGAGHSSESYSVQLGVPGAVGTWTDMEGETDDDPRRIFGSTTTNVFSSAASSRDVFDLSASNGRFCADSGSGCLSVNRCGDGSTARRSNRMDSSVSMHNAYRGKLSVAFNSIGSNEINGVTPSRNDSGFTEAYEGSGGLLNASLTTGLAKNSGFCSSVHGKSDIILAAASHRNFNGHDSGNDSVGSLAVAQKHLQPQCEGQYEDTPSQALQRSGEGRKRNFSARSFATGGNLARRAASTTLTSGYAGQQDLDRDGQSQASSESMANDELAYSEDVGLTAGGSREEKMMTDNNRARTFSMLAPCDLGKQPTGNIRED
jgi:hypothetical protein